MLKAFQPPYSTLLIIWVLFVLSIGADLFSTLFVLENVVGVFELSPALSDPRETRLSAFLMADIPIFFAVTVVFLVLYLLPTPMTKRLWVRMVFSNLSLVVFILATAKIWFAAENLNLYFWGSNVAQKTQYLLETIGIADIDTRAKAMIVSTTIGVAIAFFVSRFFFSRFPLFQGSSAKIPKSPRENA